ncbi:MAG TPA: zf-HC2 domain-containing protein [Symbiobacteriaceae bacterium]|nr:zf-HC2 domain-containing protein [Symbiobacteriaceae bacterium]
MTCRDLTDMLIAYQSGELAPAQHEFVALHLEQCADCRRALADLQLTRRQLEALRSDPWQPQLTDRIAGALARERATATAGRWLGALLRTGAAAVVAGAVVLAAFVLAPGLQSRSAAPAAGTSALLVAGTSLVRVDSSAGKVDRWDQATAGAGVVSGGGKRFAISAGTLLEYGPTPDDIRVVARKVDGRLAGAAPDGRTVWLVRSAANSTYAIDAVDVATGAVTPDSHPKAGLPGQSAVSPDGRQLLLMVEIDGLTYLKVIDTATATREEAHPLLTYTRAARPLPAPDGKTVWVAGEENLARVIIGDADRVTYRVVPGLTPAAALSPDGRRLAAAGARGGLLLVDPTTGRVVTRTTGPAYTDLAWQGDWLYAARDGELDILRPTRLAPVLQVKLPAGPVHDLNVR